MLNNNGVICSECIFCIKKSSGNVFARCNNENINYGWGKVVNKEMNRQCDYYKPRKK